MVKLKTIQLYSFAEMVKEILENEGIETVLKKKDVLASAYQAEMGEFILYVNEEDLEAAKKVLEQIEFAAPS
ncbi:DUF2007 domain-containing protein [bacterium]|nr:DUF2007 domain-containing protein [bacterium]